MIDLSKLLKEDFEPYINSFFALEEENGLMNLELIEVEESSSSGTQGFSLMFKGSVDKLLPQRIYPLKHEKMGKLEIFIVPVRKDEEGSYYQAIFTKLKK